MKNNPVGCDCKRCRDYNSQVINGRNTEKIPSPSVSQAEDEKKKCVKQAWRMVEERAFITKTMIEVKNHLVK